MRHASLGPEFTDAQVRAELETVKVPFKYHENIAATSAQLVAEGKIVGWFQGRMEFGPRSLGGRSILGDPRSSAMQATMRTIRI